MKISILSAATTLFLIMDPLGNIPIFAGILKNVDRKKQSWIILREHLISFCSLILVLLVGARFTMFIGLRQESIAIGGGIVLFLIAIKMIFPTSAGWSEDQEEGEPFIVPLAIPLITGPSTIATLLLVVSTYPNSLMNWFFSVCIAWTGSLLVLSLSPIFLRILKRRILLATERLMGMVLVVISVQLFFEGLVSFAKLTFHK